MSLLLNWPAGAPPQEIAGGQVHVWAWPLDADSFEESEIRFLDAEETQRYHRFHFGRDRARFAISHLNMRRILGAYLHLEPGEVSFRTNPFGKPEIVAGPQAGRVYFNLSHSRSIALLAISRDTEVGVDIEDVKPIEPEVAERYFSRVEQSALASLEGDAWLDGFYRCWTRKEAILKAEGVGLNLRLGSFDVSLLPGIPATLLGSRPPAAFRFPWTLHDLASPLGTFAALATGSLQSTVSCYRLQDRSRSDH